MPSGALKYQGRNKWTDKHIENLLVADCSSCRFGTRAPPSSVVETPGLPLQPPLGLCTTRAAAEGFWQLRLIFLRVLCPQCGCGHGGPGPVSVDADHWGPSCREGQAWV